MINTSTYKYINLLIKIIVGVIALWFIYLRLKDDFLLNINKIEYNQINFSLLILAFVLMFFNWGIESFKWKQSIKKTQNVSLFKAISIVFTAVLASLVTPNRIGEVPVRALLLNRQKFKELTSRTIISSFSQLIITVVLGTIGFIVVSFYFNIILNPIVTLVLCVSTSVLTLLLYFNTNGVKKMLYLIPFIKTKKIGDSLSDFSSQELSYLLFLSFLRYIVFSIQFYLILFAFGIELIAWKQWILIPVCFLFASIIPTLLISEIGVRGSVALLVFGAVSDQSLMIILASITLWLINVAFPAIFGLTNIKQLKLVKEE